MRITSSLYKAGADVTIILSYDENKEDGAAILVLARFHKLGKGHGSVDPKFLLKKIQDQLKNNGFERRRSGGSSGPVTYSKNLMQMMHTANISPRKASANIWLLKEDETWLMFYINRSELRAVHAVKYTNPVEGGQFVMPSDLLQNEIFIQNFYLAKNYCGLILHKLQSQCLVQDETIPVAICPQAVQLEIDNIADARAFCVARAEKSWDQCDWRNNFLEFYNCQNIICTLVCHDVGNHRDVFRGSNSLENRIGFKVANWREKGGGRSGSEDDDYMFVILDWTALGHARKLVFNAAENQTLPGGAASFDAKTKLSKAIWEKFVELNNGKNVHFPARVKAKGITNIKQLAYPPTKKKLNTKNNKK